MTWLFLNLILWRRDLIGKNGFIQRTCHHPHPVVGHFRSPKGTIPVTRRLTLPPGGKSWSLRPPLLFMDVAGYFPAFRTHPVVSGVFGVLVGGRH